MNTPINLGEIRVDGSDPLVKVEHLLDEVPGEWEDRFFPSAPERECEEGNALQLLGKCWALHPSRVVGYFCTTLPIEKEDGTTVTMRRWYALVTY